VYCELLRLRRRDSLAKTTNIFYLDCTLNRGLVDIIDRFVRDDERSFLGPLEHVGFLDFVREQQLFVLD